MTTDKLIPADAHLAAKRGFIRTTAQAYGTALAGGVTIVLVSDAVQQITEGNAIPLLIAVAVTVVSPVIAGAASYASILARGIPVEYTPEIPPTDAETDRPAELPPHLRG